MACSKAHRLHASDITLKNARIVGTRVSARGLCERIFRSSSVSDGRVYKLHNLDTGGHDMRQHGVLGAHVT